MQLQDIVGEVRKTLGEVEPSGYGSQQPGDGTWDNAQIIGYINEAQGVLTHGLRFEGTNTITLNTSTNAYNLPTDCLEDGVRKLVYNTTGALGPVPCDPIDLDEYEKLILNPPNVAGNLVLRYKYTVWGGQLLITPYPQNNTDTATLYYYKTVTDLSTATDVSIIPKRFHIALVYFALARCQEAVEESGLFAQAMGEFQKYADQMRRELSRKSRDRNRVRPR